MILDYIRRYKYLLFVVLLSFLPLYSLLLSSQLVYTQDGWTHLIRGAAYFKALRDFNIPVRWAGDLNYGFGMPLFVFEFQIPYILFSILIACGLSLVVSFKILLITSYIFAGFFMFLFAREFFENDFAAFSVAILYQFSPYRFVDMLLRGSIGECFVFTFFPLVLWGIARLLHKKITSGFFLIAVGTVLLLLSHIATGGMMFAVAFFLFILLVRGKSFILGILGFLFGFALAAYYWIGAVVEHKYTLGDLFVKDLYKANFPGIVKLFFPDVTNAKFLRVGDVPVTVGIMFTVLILVLLWYVFKFTKLKSKERYILIFSLLVTFGSLFMMTDVSKMVWEHVTLLRQFQFPWRFLSPIGFALALFFGMMCIKFKIKKEIILGVCFLTIVASIAFWIPQLGYRPVSEKEYWNYPKTTTYFGETDVIWSAGPATHYPKNRVEIISGNGTIQNFGKRNALQTFTIDSTQSARVLSNTEYFPGWKAYVDGKETQIQFQDINYRGLITFFVPAGTHSVSVKFTETKIELLGDAITILSLLFIYPIFFVTKKLLYEK